jgi:hypothetical protein
MKVWWKEMKAVQESMEAKMDATQEKINGGQEDKKARVASLTSQIDANQREMMAKMDAWRDGTEAYLERKGPTTVEMVNAAAHL